ncbi:Ig-like domain-containing protein [Photobacterium leiognathi]|uniref:Ig-like domain-containing protein n=1 Tax=Photobacterium leiognathi TaxID=553611 RepID=UPI0029818C3C|nr:Ig-like domain-containing protein [Photobacterium leiognathi]
MKELIQVKSTWCLTLLCLLALFILSGCHDKSSTSNDSNVVSIVLSIKGKSDVPTGLNALMVATATYQDGSKKNVSSEVNWILDNKNFTDNGLTSEHAQRFKANKVTGGSRTLVKATFDGVTSKNTLALTVSDATVVDLKVMPPQASVPAGYSQQFYADAILSDGRVLDVTSEDVLSWKMNDEKIEHGLAKTNANQAGQTLVISASAVLDNQTYNVPVTLNVSDLTVEQVEVQPVDGKLWNTNLAVDQRREIVALATLSDNTIITLDNNDVTWSPKDNSGTVAVDVIDNHAYAKGLKKGLGNVSAVLNNTSDSGEYSFNVYKQIEAKAAIIATETELRKGASIHLKFMSEGKDGSIVDQTEGTTWKLDDYTYAHMEGNTLIATPSGGYDPNLDYSKAPPVTVTAKKGELTDTYKVNLIDAVATMLSISPSTDKQLDYGTDLQMEAFVTYSDGVQKNVTNNPNMHWSTSSGAIAYFNKSIPGLLETGTPETLTVSGKFENVEDAQSISVTVNDKAPISLSLSPTTQYSAGLPQQLTVTMAYDDGTLKQLDFDDSLSVTVTDWTGNEGTEPRIANGYFYASEPGTAELTVTKTFSDGKTLTTTEQINVAKPKLISSLVVSPKHIILAPGQSQTIEIYSLDVEGKSKQLLPSQVKFKLLKKEYATIDTETGTIKANKAGNATLTVSMENVPSENTVDGKTPTANVDISVEEKALESIKVALPENLTLIPGQAVPLKARGRYNDGTSNELSNNTVEWKNVDSTDAFIISDNTLKANKAGSGSVSATFRATPSITDTLANVTVKNASFESLNITPHIKSLPVGFSQQFEAYAVEDTGKSFKLNKKQVTWQVTSPSNQPLPVTYKTTEDGSLIVTSKTSGQKVTVKASVNASAFPDVDSNSITNSYVFDTVDADVASLLITSPPNGSDVIEGVAYPLGVVAIQKNGQKSDAWDKVSWTTSEHYTIDQQSHTITFNKGDATQTVLTATPKKDAIPNYSDSTQSTVNLLAHKQGIAMTIFPNSIPTISSTPINAKVHAFEDGKEITDSVTWGVAPYYGSIPDGVKVTQDGTVHAGNGSGAVWITATTDDGRVGYVKLDIYQFLGTCNNLTEIDGQCLMTADYTIGTNTYTFTANPSVAAANLLGFDSADLEYDDFPVGAVSLELFSVSNSEDLDSSGFDWCRKLNEIRFDGQTDWHVATSNELSFVKNNSLWSRETWPVSRYMTGDITSDGKYLGIYPEGEDGDDEHISDNSTSVDWMVSCVSKKGTD